MLETHIQSTEQPTNQTIAGPAISSIVTDSEEPLPSLSDGHDYEPQLEFDDTELEQAPDPSKWHTHKHTSCTHTTHTHIRFAYGLDLLHYCVYVFLI